LLTNAQDKIALAVTQTLLVSAGVEIVQPRSYTFPITSLTTFLSEASVITNLLVGYLAEFNPMDSDFIRSTSLQS
jgi:hypothetical protein